MATIAPKEKSPDVPVYEFKEDISVNIVERNVKLRKSTLFAWGIIVPLLIIAVIIFGSLYLIARAKLQKYNDAVRPPGHYDLSVCKRKFDVPPLFIVSSDGFRDSYLEHNITPSIQRLINYGTHSKYMLPTFPSKTFPNHYTIATGLYPAWHGIVDNGFYDTQFKDFFKKSTNQSGWYLGEPIWETAQKAGLKSAVFFWPGSEGIGKLPSFWMKYNSSVPFTYRIDTLIKWLKLPDGERPSLIQAYFEEPDYAGHMGGPDSQTVRTAMILMDGMINYLISRLTEEGLMGCINFILLSDHGMQQMDKKKSVVTMNYLGPQFNDIFFSGVVARVEINESAHSSQNNADNIINDIISKLECQHGNNYIAYRKDLVPIRFHYAGSPRIGDIVIKGRPGVCIFKTDEEKESYKLLGDHGYDNRIISMRAIFIAVGPDIAQNREISAFQNIELYNLFANLLRIDAAPNNGTDGILFPVLRNPPALPITAVDQPSDQCTEKINMKVCNFSRNCPLMDNTYQNCSVIFHSSVSASYHFTGELCNLQFCDAIIHFDKKLKKTIMVEGIMRNTIWTEEIKENCVTYIDNVTQTNSCETAKDESYSLISLFGKLDSYYTFDLARLVVPKVFVDGIWQYVLNETAEYLVQYGYLRFFSGAIYDQDGDGVRDSDEVVRKSDPSHLFFVLMWCKNRALIGHNLCKDTVFVPYILPFKGRNLNCLKPSEYLYDNTVRMRDIELLTGMEFFTDRNIWSNEEAIQLRTSLPERRRSS
uniref:NUC domain-containing protein n=2 Tax=Wuchereria bancrofti TaxID=6293 RepID=A0A1I8EAB8_WUCBA